MTLGIGFGLLAAAAVASIAAGWFRGAWATRSLVACWLLLAGGSVAFTVAGALGVAGTADPITLGTVPPFGSASLTVDRLSGLFLIISFGVAIPVLLAGAGRAAERRPRLPAALAVTVASAAVIFTADNLFVLLFGWESLTFAFFLLAGFDRERDGRGRASVAAVTFGKASGGALLFGGLLLAAGGHGFLLTDLSTGAHGTTGQVAYAALLLGFAVKVGVVPTQVWLPSAYAAAPGPARAVMAGVAVNVGFYGMWRTLEILGSPPVWLTTIVLVLAGITAVLGIVHAVGSPDLRTLVAWSSVENAGVILAGYGVALMGSAAHDQRLLAAGLVAATAQVVAHSLGKSLLFSATSAIEAATGTTDLTELRGVARRLPWAGTGLVVGALTLAGLPLTAGFASEWLTLESLMQQFRVSDLALELGAATAGALVALTFGVAGVTFVRLVALTAFGHPPVAPTDGAVDRAAGHRVGVGLMIAGCLGVAAVAPLEFRLIAAGLRPVAGDAASGTRSTPWVIQPVFDGFSALSPSWLWIAIPVLVLVTGLTTVAFSGSRLWHVRRVPAWHSASPGVDGGVGYTSLGYANTIRTVLANVLLTRRELAQEAGVATGGGHDGAAPDHVWSEHLRYHVDVVEVVERFLYGPLHVGLLAVARWAKRLQSGRLDAYMAYMFLALVAVLAVVAAVA
jgi:formate hydrogenlyase subunit 3/multisubunit Na+/H+ antiporter MnhD subunit